MQKTYLEDERLLEHQCEQNRIAVCVYTTNAGETIRAVEIAKAIRVYRQRQNQQRQNCDAEAPSLAEVAGDKISFDGNEFKDAVIRFFTYRGCLPGSPKRKIDYEHLIHFAGFDVQYFGKVEADVQIETSVYYSPQQGIKESYKNDVNRHKSNQSQSQNFSAAILDDEMLSAWLDAERTHQGIFPPPYDNRAYPYLRAIIKTLSEFRPTLVVYGLFPEVAAASAICGWKRVAFASIPSSWRVWIWRNLVYGTSFNTGHEKTVC